MRYWDDCITLTTGCTKVPVNGSLKDSACLNCWAEKNHNLRMRHANPKYDHPFNEVRVHSENIEKLNKKGKPKVFSVWNDALHPAASFGTFDLLLSAMIGNPNKLLICTKRTERIEEYFNRFFPIDVPLNNVYFATTIENQEMADLRLSYLRDLPFRTFLSVEPMLSPIHIPTSTLKRMSVVIVGCESGRNPRPTQFSWIQDLKDQCKSAGIPFLCKQVRDENGKMHHDGMGLSTVDVKNLWK